MDSPTAMKAAKWMTACGRLWRMRPERAAVSAMSNSKRRPAGTLWREPLGGVGGVEEAPRALVAHEAGEGGCIGDVELEEAAGGHVVAVAFGEVVDHRDIVALFGPQSHGMRADVADRKSTRLNS